MTGTSHNSYGNKHFPRVCHFTRTHIHTHLITFISLKTGFTKGHYTIISSNTVITALQIRTGGQTSPYKCNRILIASGSFNTQSTLYTCN